MADKPKRRGKTPEKKPVPKRPRRRATPLVRCLAALREHGLLLASDPRLPSVTTLVSDGSIVGSWWKHADARDIYAAQNALAARDDVLPTRLVCGKVTYVDRRLWPALLAVARSGDGWQVDLLPPRESALLDIIEREGAVRVDDALGERLDAVVSDLGRELEARLLVLGGQAHTESGAHARTLTAWTRWAEDVGVKPGGDRAASYATLDAAAKALGPSAWLPWWKKPLRRRW